MESCHDPIATPGKGVGQRVSQQDAMMGGAVKDEITFTLRLNSGSPVAEAPLTADQYAAAVETVCGGKPYQVTAATPMLAMSQGCHGSVQVAARFHACMYLAVQAQHRYAYDFVYVRKTLTTCEMPGFPTYLAAPHYRHPILFPGCLVGSLA